jgi:hypothetical protein
MNQKIDDGLGWRTGVVLKIVKNSYIGGDVKGGTIIAGDENEVKKKAINTSLTYSGDYNVPPF